MGGWAGHTLAMTSALSSGWVVCGSLQRWLLRQGDLSSDPGPVFPSVCVPTLVELMSVLGESVSVPGEAQVGGCVLNKALPPGNVFWSITKHTHRDVSQVTRVSAPAHPHSVAIIKPRPLPSATPTDMTSLYPQCDFVYRLMV